MDWKKRIRASGSKQAEDWALPRVIVEMEPGFVMAGQIDAGTRQVRRIAACDLQPKTTSSEAGGPADAKALAGGPEVHRALEQVTKSIGNGAGRTGLLVPDPIVRVSVLEFESLPDDRQEAEALVRWRMKDGLPYPVEEARVAYQMMWDANERREVLAMVARNSATLEYEKAVQDRLEAPTVTLPATAALLPLLPESLETAQLLVHVCSSWVTTVLVGGGRVRLWRNRDLSLRGEAEVAGEIEREAARAVASSRDHHQLEVSHVWVSARRGAGPNPLAALARAVAAPVEPLLPAGALATNLSSAERALFDQFGATLAGLIMNFAEEARPVA